MVSDLERSVADKLLRAAEQTGLDVDSDELICQVTGQDQNLFAQYMEGMIGAASFSSGGSMGR